MGYVLYALSSFGLGALHALEPGHGKAVIGAYMVGSRGRSIDAVILGLVVTFTHTGIVIVLGILSSVAAQYFVPERVEKVLGVVSGLLIVAVGAWMIGVRWRQARHGAAHHHAQGHDHAHGEDAAERRFGLAALVGLGMSGGIVPCPAALAVLLASVGIGGFVKAIALVFIFSLGMATTLMVLGLACLRAGRFAESRVRDGRLSHVLPVASAVIVTLIGLALTVHSVGEL